MRVFVAGASGAIGGTIDFGVTKAGTLRGGETTDSRRRQGRGRIVICSYWRCCIGNGESTHGRAGVYNPVDDDPVPQAMWLPAFAKLLGALEPPA